MKKPAQTVLIGGASGALGRALAPGFACAGARALALFYGSNTGAAGTAAEAAKTAGAERAEIFGADVCDRSALDLAFGRADESFPDGFDAAALCAAATKDAVLAQCSPEDWGRILDTNLSGAWDMLTRTVRRMPRGGSVIVVGSIRGFTGNRGQAAYAASKAGLAGLVRSAARELAADNIRVNLVFPGLMRSAMTDDRIMKNAGSQNILGRPNTMSEIVRATVFFSSLENVSGQTFNLDSRIF